MFLNDRAALYNKEIIPRWRALLPYDLAIDYYATKYHLRDKERKYPIVASDNRFPTGTPLPDKEQIYIEELKGVYWTNDRIIVDVQTSKGQQLLQIKVAKYVASDSSTENYVEDYHFVTQQALDKMDDNVIFEAIPRLFFFWPILGFIYLIGIIYLIFSKKMTKILGG